MRVLILADAQFAKHERALIERVVVGLAVEGVEATLILPKDRGLEGFGSGVLADPIWYADRGLLITQKIRSAQIARSVHARSDDADSPIDVVHVMGGGAWGMGRELARLLDAGLALELWRAGLADQARSLSLTDDDRVMYLVPERSFEESLRKLMPTAMVRCVAWGASLTEQPVPIFRKDKLISIVLMGSGRQADLCGAAFEGIADAIAQRSDVMIFANLEVVQRAGLWKRVKANKLEDRFTIIDRSEDRRDLLLRCDMLIYPETLHEERTLLLDAMGAGLIVVTGDDNMIQALSADSGVLVVQKPTPDEWASTVRSVIESRDGAVERAAKTREYIRKNRRTAVHIESLTDAYSALVATRPQQIDL